MAKQEPDLSRLFHALSDPTRRAILTRLASGPAPVTELAQPSGLRLPTVMRHLSVLEEAGLVVSAKDGRVRSCAVVPEAMAPVRSWLDEQRAIWEARLEDTLHWGENGPKHAEAPGLQTLGKLAGSLGAD